MKCPNPNCGAIMLIDWYKEYNNRYVFQETCTVCRVIHKLTQAKSVMGY